RIPHRREQDQDQQRRHLLRRVRAQHDRHEDERAGEHPGEARERDRKAVPPLDGVRRDGQIVAPRRRKKPPRGEASTARKTRRPARIEYCGSICAPIVWAQPSTMPPTSVPQSDPRPPITTASKAKISCVGPAKG